MIFCTNLFASEGGLGVDFLNCQWDVIIITSGAEFLISMNSFDSSSFVCLFFEAPPAPGGPVDEGGGSLALVALDPADIAVTIVVPDAGIVVICVPAEAG